MNSRHPRSTPNKRVPAVPVHRGPQAGSQSLGSHGGPSGFHHAPNAALLIDFDNVTMGIRSDLGNELRNLLSSDIIKGKVAVQRAYADWRRYPQYMVPLAEASIDTIQATAYGSSKKNATDIRLAVDAVELVFTRPEIGTYILFSGDSDFSSLVLKLKEYGKYVIGVGIRESSSDLLVMNCDEYYSYNALTGLMKSGDEPPAKHDPWELVSEAVTRMKRNGDVMRSDRLKQVMQEIDGTFDEKEHGYSKFSRFCMEAVQRGLLSVNKLENGQLEVDVPRGRDVPAAEPRRLPRAPEREPARARGRDGADQPRARGPEAGDGRAGDAEPAEERSRRGRHGRGRRGARGDRPPRGDRAEPADRPPVDVDYVSNEAVEERGEAEGVAAGAGGEAPAARGGETAPREASPASQADDRIGGAGERLSRSEALGLVRRAVESLTTSADDIVRASEVRARARELLGRESETLAERHFGRILADAHDANLIDLRRRGDDFEVARAADAAAVADQLARAAPTPTPTSVPAASRGMGPRGGGVRGRPSLGARAAGPPPELLAIGVVDVGVDAAPPSDTVEADAPPVAEPARGDDAPAEAPPARRAAKRGKTPARGGRAAKKSAAAKRGDAGHASAPAEKKPRRPRGRKSPAADSDQ